MTKPTRHDRGQQRPSPQGAPRGPRPEPRATLDYGLAGATALPAPAWLAPALAEMGIELEEGDAANMGRFLGMLLRANEALNLTGVTDPEEAWRRHVLDSLTLIPMLAELEAGAEVVDVGSGGGLPGIPLAIGMPHLNFTLMESTGKKAGFLEAAAAALGLTNVRVAAVRAERAGQDRGVRGPSGRSGGHRERYDAVVARALGPLNVLAELTVPLAKAPEGSTPGGIVLLIKGQKAAEELAEAAGALELLRASHSGTIETPTGRVVVLAKDGPTPRTYPRADGEPKRAPLGAKRGTGRAEDS